MIGLTGIDALEAEMKDHLAAKDTYIEVLQTRISFLESELKNRDDLIKSLETKLEIDGMYELNSSGEIVFRPMSKEEKQSLDGIDCRDATIRLQQDIIDKYRRKLGIDPS